MCGGKRRVDGVEGRDIVGAHIARRHHAGKKNLDPPAAKPRDDCIEIAPCPFRRQSTKHVIATKNDDHRLRIIGKRPVEARQPTGGGVSRHAGIDDRYLGASGGEVTLQLVGK